MQGVATDIDPILPAEGIPSDKDLAVELGKIYPGFQPFIDEIGEKARASAIADKVKIYRLAKAFSGNDITPYKDELEIVFTKSLKAPMDTPKRFLADFANRLRWMVSEIYPKIKSSELQMDLARLIFTADTIENLTIPNVENFQISINSYTSMLKNEVGLYLQQQNGRLTLDEHRAALRAMGEGNNNIKRSLHYMGELFRGYTNPVDTKRKLETIALGEIGKDYDIFQRVLDREMKRLEKEKIATDQANVSNENLIGLPKNTYAQITSSGLKEAIDGLKKYQYHEIPRYFWQVRSVFNLHGSTNPFVAVPVFLSAMGSRPIIIGIFIVLAIVVIGAAIYFIVRAVKKEKMNIIPRSTLRTLNPYNQTFFV